MQPSCQTGFVNASGNHGAASLLRNGSIQGPGERRSCNRRRPKAYVEGASLVMMRSDATPAEHLSNVDPIMRRLIRDIGPFTLAPRAGRSPFEALARAIAYQQLHDRAAFSILQRFIALFPGRRFPT